MRTRLLALPLACSILLTLHATPARSQTLVTFDDLPAVARDIASGYQGLTWSNLWVMNGFLIANDVGTNGYYYGMVSPSNVAYNAGGNPAEIDSATNFNFFSAYLTGAWNSNLNIEVEGFNGAKEIYDTVVAASATNPTLFTFNYLDIDRLYFDSYGGQSAGFTDGGGVIFVMDNFMFEFIPEPSTFLLAALGGLSLIAFLKRKRRRSGADRMQNHS
ncbi:MAG: PEP-CTERM sorting domain-containing protein [Verrucomicrobiia bacterium]